MFCKHCGTQLDDDVIVCTSCGKQVQGLKMNNESNSINELVNNKSAWYYEWWFIILMIVFVFPVGIILLVLKLK